MRKILYPFILALLNCCALRDADSSRLSYPDPKPDSIALTFLPGIVSRPDSLDFNSAFSPDGKFFYFARSERGKYQIYVTAYNDKQWGLPKLASFSEEDYSEADPFFLSDGSLYFISDRPRDEQDSVRDYDIWRIRPLEDGQWSSPENVREVNSDSTEYYVSLAPNKNVYFASNRAGGFGSYDIYVSKFINGKYTTPVNLGPSINSAGMEHDPLILNNECALIFTAVSRTAGYGEADLHYSTRESSNQPWQSALNMGALINTPTYEYCPYLTPDGKFFFFSSQYDVKWTAAEHLPFDIE
jgi:Tol biopolymer transport system component